LAKVQPQETAPAPEDTPAPPAPTQIAYTKLMPAGIVTDVVPAKIV